MKSILVTGANGQLGMALQKLSRTMPNAHFIFCSREDLDITQPNDIQQYFEDYDIGAVINSAAYTQVDKAETEQNLAHEINSQGVTNLAKACAKADAWLFHISTDFVFNGQQNIPYKESDLTAPIGAYGHSKLEGEEAALQNHTKSVIFRTSWLYSTTGHNFVKTMLRLGKEREKLNVVYDQIGCPTFAEDLAVTLLQILQQPDKLQGCEIYHFSNKGVASWYDFAVAIMQLAKIECEVNPIETKDYPTPAQRPNFSVLDTQKIRNAFGIEIPYWRDSLENCLYMMEEIK
ncbi:MAG: dTDP-4-dehydrorhamnose reductase [Chitinophagales bacterium]